MLSSVLDPNQEILVLLSGRGCLPCQRLWVRLLLPPHAANPWKNDQTESNCKVTEPDHPPWHHRGLVHGIKSCASHRHWWLFKFCYPRANIDISGWLWSLPSVVLLSAQPWSWKWGDRKNILRLNGSQTGSERVETKTIKGVRVISENISKLWQAHPASPAFPRAPHQMSAAIFTIKAEQRTGFGVCFPGWEGLRFLPSPCWAAFLPALGRRQV